LKIKKENDDSLKSQSTLVVDGDFKAMEKYRTVILHEEIDGTSKTEQAAVFSVDYDSETKTSTITLRKPIDGDFTKCGVKIWGNVVTMTQGKTVNETILGSGQGEEPYQAFDVPRSPLTFEMHGKEGLEGAIDIKVSDLVWTQQDDFLDSKPGDRHYMIETDDAGKSRVVFGDGVNGSRLPTGKDNVVTQFRTGQGTNGNVSAGILKKAASKPPFLDKVSNPDKTSGGSDPDTEGQLREKIPTQHITFDRAVSLQDYADLALSCSGISKAKAGWRWLHNRAYVVLAVAGSGGDDLSSDALKVLREYVDARRDPNQPLLVQQVDIVHIELSVSVTASDGYDTERVKDAVAKALGTEMLADGTYPFFSFERLNIGMSIHKKDVYKIIENIPGVELISHLEIKRSTEPAGYLKPSFCPDDVWIYNWELPELDVNKLDITVTAKQANTLCEKAGG
jgi:predicted phage baseplate assembly protein